MFVLLAGCAKLITGVDTQHQPPQPQQQQVEVAIVGAGPAGLQWALLLPGSMSYIILEKADGAASFFQRYPRNRKLISHNKCHTGPGRSADFRLRHDWHSLLEANTTMCAVTPDFYPPADKMVDYLSDVASSLRVEYNSYVVAHERNAVGNHVLTTEHRSRWEARHVVWATGLSLRPTPFQWMGGLDPSHESYSYADFPPLDASGLAPFCLDREVVIVGSGNAAFEAADMLKN